MRVRVRFRFRVRGVRVRVRVRIREIWTNQMGERDNEGGPRRQRESRKEVLRRQSREDRAKKTEKSRDKKC